MRILEIVGAVWMSCFIAFCGLLAGDLVRYRQTLIASRDKELQANEAARIKAWDTASANQQ